MTDVTCPVCGGTFPAGGGRKTCSDICRVERHRQQLAEHAAKRAATRSTARANRLCARPGCGTDFTPLNSRHLCCGRVECEAWMLQQAVQRQRDRRAAAKANRKPKLEGRGEP